MPLATATEREYRLSVPWCGPSSTAKVHTEKLGVRSDAAPTSDWPGLFIGTTVAPAYFPKCRRIVLDIKENSRSILTSNIQPTTLAQEQRGNVNERTRTIVIAARPCAGTLAAIARGAC